MTTNAVEVLQVARGASNPEDGVQPPATALLLGYEMREIPREEAFDLVVAHHYLHRRTTYRRAFGLFDGDTLVGGIIFGIPSSFTLRCGICGVAEAQHVVELTRLWVDDSVPKNGESRLIGFALREMKRLEPDLDIVVSFADEGAGHHGSIYQATNFLYTGTSARFRDPVPKGFKGHRLTAGKTSDLKEWYRATYNCEPTGLSTFDLMELKFGKGNVEWVERTRKHRYIIFNSNRRRERELRRKLTYKVLPYPKVRPKVTA
jgi:hypothetical protein